MSIIKTPTYDRMMNPLLEGMKELGGSGTIDEIANKVAELMELSDEQLQILHDPDKGGRSEFEYRLAWTRTYLKKFGLLENSSRGVWSLTPDGRNTESVDTGEVIRYVKDQLKERREKQLLSGDEIDQDDESIWQDELLEILLSMDPSSFERLIQRVLRESGFVQVEVTGRSGDGGVDGKGIMRLGGLLGFHVIFQAKRYKGSVGPEKIRDFRGAMVGRADKGLFVTTGTFTKEATKEASRDGAPPIDLIDGGSLVMLLKKFTLGVKTEVVKVEQVTVDGEWFIKM